jgi:hypothetical protein
LSRTSGQQQAAALAGQIGRGSRERDDDDPLVLPREEGPQDLQVRQGQERLLLTVCQQRCLAAES